MTILDQLAGHARERVAAKRAELDTADLRAIALDLPRGDFAFERLYRQTYRRSRADDPDDGLCFVPVLLFLCP